jgi:2-hydroxy-3-keto-5-methylthiopentenyl-1-phosphate phosphatase
MEISPLNIEKKIYIFSDFDGTFSAKDVGNRIFTFFSDGKNIPLIRHWKDGLLTSRECLLGEAKLLTITPEQFYSFLGDFQLVSGAVELYQETITAKIPFFILSDGLDLYIKHILKKNGLEEIHFFSNRGKLENNRLIIEFPYDNDGCPRCGSCKGTRIAEIIGREKERPTVVFIGDGLSDICALPQSDIIFARSDLLTYCRSNNYNAIEYENFYDILEWLRKAGIFPG